MWLAGFDSNVCPICFIISPLIEYTLMSGRAFSPWMTINRVPRGSQAKSTMGTSILSTSVGMSFSFTRKTSKL